MQKINVRDFSMQFYVRRNVTNKQRIANENSRQKEEPISLFHGDCCSRARSLSLSLSLSLFLFPPRTCHCLNRVIEYLRPAVAFSRYLSASLPACARAKTRRPTRPAPWSRRMAPALVILPFLPPFSPRSVKRDVPARNDARARDWCSSSRCLLDPKPRILLPGFAPGAISACPPASDTNRSRLQGVPKSVTHILYI